MLPTKRLILKSTGGAAGQSESHYYVSGTLSGSVPKTPHPGSNTPLATPSAEEAEGASLPFPDSAPTMDEDVGAVPVYADTPACDENGAKTRQSTAVAIGHNSHWCPEADPMRSFTLVDSNRIHATCVTFCRCQTPDGQRGETEFQQLLRAGIFPGSVKEPKTGYTLGLLEYFRQQRSQGKGSASNFVLVLQCMADPFFAGQVPDIYDNFLAITRWHQHLDIVLRRGQANGVEVPLPGEPNRPYPNRICRWWLTCPDIYGASQELSFWLKKNTEWFFRHLISNHNSLDGNFKMNMFHKRNDGSDHALTDGRMYFPKQTEYDRIAATYVVKDQDKEVPCNTQIGSIRHQGSVKYGNTAISGVVTCACDHTVVGFALGTFTQREHLTHTNSPPHGPESANSIVWSYDSFCSFVVYQIQRAMELFLDEEWLHTLLAELAGQILADHINGHGPDCQMIWQAVYFACRAHFHGETAEMVSAFLNPLGSSTRQMTLGARHDTINFVIDAWNILKVLRQAELSAEERLTALRLFELHMVVVEDLSKQNATEVVGWSRLSRKSTRSADGKPRSVYQHESKSVMMIENMLASMMAQEDDKVAREDRYEARTSIAQWIRDGMFIERDQQFIITLVVCHREHPLQETWATITKQRETLNTDLKKFRKRQRVIYLRLMLSGVDADEPELTAIQLSSYRIKHGQQLATAIGATTECDAKLRDAEIKPRCREVENGIVAVQAASLALSAVKKARDLDFRGQAGMTCSQRNLQKADMMKTFEITMYNRARAALITLGHLAKDTETHLHRAKGDSRLFDGTVWYLQSGVKISGAAMSSTLSTQGLDSEDDEPQLVAGTQSLKHLASGFTKSPRKAKRLRDIAPDDVTVEVALSSEVEDSDLEMSPSKTRQLRASKQKKTKKDDGRRGETGGVQEGKCPSSMVSRRSRDVPLVRADSVVWKGLGDREETHNGGINGAATFARMQGVMCDRLEYNAKVIFKSTDSGAHQDWVTATTFDELVTKIDGWRDMVFKWMDEMGVQGFLMSYLAMNRLAFVGFRQGEEQWEDGGTGMTPSGMTGQRWRASRASMLGGTAAPHMLEDRPVDP
ncbi:hypothetical protein B0H10DRAFT_1944051 [Mycena sp. CBHHK59/15]|nr:hypothetical protein B0H10DRAFT_1944051 [Mycena sp. CBHHK59/15]